MAYIGTGRDVMPSGLQLLGIMSLPVPIFAMWHEKDYLERLSCQTKASMTPFFGSMKTPVLCCCLSSALIHIVLNGPGLSAVDTQQ